MATRHRRITFNFGANARRTRKPKTGKSAKPKGSLWRKHVGGSSAPLPK